MSSIFAGLSVFLVSLGAEPEGAESVDLTLARQLASQVTIYRDEWGVPHVDGPTDASVAFGFLFAQCEDNFWQIEDTLLMALGRYAEAHGNRGLQNDLLNRAFEIVPSSQRDYPTLEPEMRAICEAAAAALNYYTALNPAEPRVVRRFEPWHIVAGNRMLAVEMCLGKSRVSSQFMPRNHDEVWRLVGSNAWAVGPSRTKNESTMLFTNPHQPWYGFGQFYEGHLRSGQGWNFSGTTFFGSPLPSLGHNEHLGYTFTVNEPDIADAWIEKFDDPEHPNRYRYGNGYREAVEWKDTVRIRLWGGDYEEREYTFRKTHHGPILNKLSDTEYLSFRIAKLEDSLFVRQAYHMLRARNLDEFRTAMGLLNFQFFNCCYADRDGNIMYIYNGAVPKRNTAFDWSKPVDGSDPRTEWQGYHSLDELPQLINPSTGYVQSCNSTPFLTTDDDNPYLNDYPPYMVGQDKWDDKRRAKMCRYLLRQMEDVTLEDMERYAFDTTFYWALTELPKFERGLAGLKERNPELAEKVRPYLDHLLDWDRRSSLESTPASLCAVWYEELYGPGYPAETLKPEFIREPDLRYEALIRAANRLESTYGTWKVRWGDIHRCQRHSQVADFALIPFSDSRPSLPLAGAPGPLGVVFTQYYTPSIDIPLLRSMKMHYGIVGPTYMAVTEFLKDRVEAKTLIQYGSSSHPDSPHFMDQAQLLSEQRMKPQWFDWEDVRKHAKRVYQPGGGGQDIASGQ